MELITTLQIYASAIRILAKGYLPNTLVTASKLQEILNKVRTAFLDKQPRLPGTEHQLKLLTSFHLLL